MSLFRVFQENILDIKVILHSKMCFLLVLAAIFSDCLHPAFVFQATNML